jgi:trehalose/maltose hydrolase-like predicted phosphorylase
VNNSWILKQDNFDINNLGKYETLFTLGNGNLGLRGNLEENDSNYENGTYINGFYETFPIKYGETAYGYAKNNQAIVNIVDGKGIRIYADGELFTTEKASSHSRELNIRTGILTRRFSWLTSSGAKLNVKTERLVSLYKNSTAVQIFEIEVSRKKVDLEIISSLNNLKESRKKNKKSTIEDPRIGSASEINILKKVEEYAEGTRAYWLHKTRGSDLSLFSGMDHSFSNDSQPVITNTITENKISNNFKFENIDGKFSFVKYLSYQHDSSKSKKNLIFNGLGDLDSCITNGSVFYINKQKEVLEDFWNRTDLIIKGDEELQFGIRFNIFHLLQSTGTDGKVSIAAKGLTGSGYEGHFFWDTEIYVLPYFIYTFPDIAKSLLSYRYSIIDKARLRAEELSHKGVLYPWRTINGEEASAYFPAGTAQYHINADISFGIHKYIKSTADNDFLINYGLEIFIETARFWYDLGEFIPGLDGAFCIHEVTGPDEYTALVNNNLYTNIMARDNLLNASKYLENLKTDKPDLYNTFRIKYDLSDLEISEWKKAAELMRIPYNTKQSLFAQDDAFLNRPVWDFEGTPSNKYPLLLHFHPLTIYRYQVIKQADLVMALFLQGRHFSLSDKKRNFDYYEALTTGDSSLSACIQGIVGMEIGYLELGMKYFEQTVLIDLKDLNGNVKDGVHTASMAGSWMMVIYGFGGMRDSLDVLSFSPRLPGTLTEVSFKINYSSCILKVEIFSDQVIYTLLEGQVLTFYNYYEKIRLLSGESIKISLLPELLVVFVDNDLQLKDDLIFDIKAAGLKKTIFEVKDNIFLQDDSEIFLNGIEKYKVRPWDCLYLTNNSNSLNSLKSLEIPFFEVENAEDLTINGILQKYKEFSLNWKQGIVYNSWKRT